MSLNDDKLRAELALAQQQLRDLRHRYWLDLVKSAVLLIGGIATFVLLQAPDSVLRRQETEEELRREKAKLLLDWMREPDVQKRAQALTIIRAVYGDNEDKLLNQLEVLISTAAKAESVRVTTERYEAKLKERDGIQAQLAAEESGEPGSPKGRGATWAALQRRLQVVEAELNSLAFMLKSYGVALPTSVPD